jgi:glucuronokinase
MREEAVVHARAGLLGNPSDGYFGKTLSCLVSNFCARVTLEESAQLQLLLNTQGDPTQFSSMDELAATYTRQGYYGGLRLMQAACKRFAEACAAQGIALRGPNFTMRYATDIPQQVGLSGSSAIVIATLRALMHWYGVEAQFEQAKFPSLALAVEAEELGITAGLQDRVIQTYGGLVYMDFDKEQMERQGHGTYTRVDPALLPPLFLAYVLNPSDSGAIHSDVRRRWNEGDAEVRQAMRTFASFAEQGVAALASRDAAAISAMMNEAFLLRRKIFGDAVLGPDNLRMVALANQHGLQATTSGSGGAIIGLMGDAAQNAAFAESLAAEGYCFLGLQVGTEYAWAGAETAV